jgi:hypothetical protein
LGKETRSAFSIRLRESVCRAWRRYCGVVGGWGHQGELMEKALIEYMKNHPSDECKIDIQIRLGEQINGIQRELEEQILCGCIDDCLSLLEDEDCQTRGNPLQVKDELVGHVGKAVRIICPSDRLLSLLHRVKDGGYLERP